MKCILFTRDAFASFVRFVRFASFASHTIKQQTSPRNGRCNGWCASEEANITQICIKLAYALIEAFHLSRMLGMHYSLAMQDGT